jgi:hypothetical protein
MGAAMVQSKSSERIKSMSDRVIAPAYRVFLALLLTGMSAFGQIQLGKPKPVKPLPNPSIVGAPRDDVVSIAKQMLETREIPIDKEDCGSTSGECTLVTKTLVFIKGIATKSQLEHYCETPSVDVRNWVRGRYVLRFQITPATPKTSQVGVYARFEGMTNSVTGSEWVQLTSKGELEDLMLRCILDRVQGNDCKEIFR